MPKSHLSSSSSSSRRSATQTHVKQSLAACCKCCVVSPKKKKVEVVNAFTWHAACVCCCYCIYYFTALLLVCMQTLAAAAPSSSNDDTANEAQSIWPPLQHFDIWNAEPQQADAAKREMAGPFDGFAVNGIELQDNFEDIQNVELKSNLRALNETLFGDGAHSSKRQPKVIHLFPVPVDGECLSDDGRRLGNCFNAYECRQKGGTAKGECAMGFGVCCVFLANCNETIKNNITYLVSPNFPSFMPSNYSSCNLKVKLMSQDISQLRIDFYHFSLGQPNRSTGVCDGDVFSINGGPSGLFTLCGQNSGQHIYYDVGGRALPRQSMPQLYGSLQPLSYAQLYPNGSAANGSINYADQLLDITLNFTNRFSPIRLWEIRIAQIPFSQRAPAGCLQYHTGSEGILQTFNFADNGRHLANQHYRICVRQETEMCSIVYQPCDEQSFRIGGNAVTMRPSSNNAGGAGGAGAGSGAFLPASASMPSTPIRTTPMMSALLSMNTASSATGSTDATTTTTTTATTTPTTTSTTAAMTSTNGTTTAMPVPSSTAASTEASTAADEPASSPANDDADEGSGDDFDFAAPVTPAQVGVSRRPRPVNSGGSGGFDLLGFLRTAFDIRLRRKRRSVQQARQFYSTCTDRITMPCIIEDFIGTGLGPLPGCEPVHCGAQFCSSGVWPCRIESTVTPFYIGVHFGGGAGKGSAEDNIGACLRYMQVQCM